ncbi:MAG: HigA family addiction module antidote protein [Cytophagaceae bacterium]|nr:HigA family addiction module antidote protein [Cytophagaceae bacterium]
MAEEFKVIGSDGNELIPVYATHPGEVLEMELEGRGIKKSAFAVQNGIYPSHLSDLLSGKRNMNAAIALKLEKALGIEAGFWLRMQNSYDLFEEQRKMQVA